ncbi:unnamed protein product [Ambrosiozyma monospora]|uniref:Unnamed protein product n=1 Tax=Ambrosiozyma monospora TaxID=43982 RepID=A0A9W6Z1P2_AMBMO|nr:unnamed protein product [Ambrosiozyma monospora]
MKGLVRLRLARMGRKHQPVYNIVVTKNKTKRDGKPLEVIGTYNPVPGALTPVQKKEGFIPTKDVRLDFQRAKYWLGVGAQPSDAVANLFKRAGILYPEWPGPNRSPIIPHREEVPLDDKKFA